jgi:hypothetical protein
MKRLTQYFCETLYAIAAYQMNKKKRPNVTEKYVPLDEVVHTLRVSPDQMDEWLRLGVVKPFRSPQGLTMKESEFKALAYSPISLNAALHA